MQECQILGISFDTIDENRAFAEKFGFTFPLLCDIDRSIGIAYGACDEPTAEHAKRIAYLIEPCGTICRVWDKVDTNTHATETMAALAVNKTGGPVDTK